MRIRHTTIKYIRYHLVFRIVYVMFVIMWVVRGVSLFRSFRIIIWKLHLRWGRSDIHRCYVTLRIVISVKYVAISIIVNFIRRNVVWIRGIFHQVDGKTVGKCRCIVIVWIICLQVVEIIFRIVLIIVQIIVYTVVRNGIEILRGKIWRTDSLAS